MRRTLFALASAAVIACPAAAQTPSAAIEAARARLDQLDPDSAYVLLRGAIGNAAGATRIRGFTLLGLAELIRGNRAAARSAFEQALRLDNALRIDSLADLHSDARLVFGEARTSVAPEVRVFVVTVAVPDSSLIVPREASLPIELRPTGRARAVSTIAPIETPLAVVWSDTQAVDIAATVRWNLAGRDSQPVADGRYVLRVTATDASGQVAPPVERYLILSRLPVDTQPAPPPIDSARLLPESYRVRRAATNRLIFAGLLGAGALIVPNVLGSGELGGGGRSVVIAGAVSLAGLVGYFKGHRTFPLPDNVRQNQLLREQDASQRGAVAAANARIIAAATVVVRVEGVR